MRRQLLFPTYQDWQDLSGDLNRNDNDVQKIDGLVQKFWQVKTLSERLAVIANIHQLTSAYKATHKESSINRLSGYANQFIAAIANVSDADVSTLVPELAAKLKIDHSYLPNHLPPHLSEPRIDNLDINDANAIAAARKAFVAARMKAHFTNLSPRAYLNKNSENQLVYPIKEKVDIETKPLAILAMRESLKPNLVLHPEKDKKHIRRFGRLVKEVYSEEANKIVKQFREDFKDNSPTAAKDKVTLTTLNPQTREPTRLIVAHGVLSQLDSNGRSGFEIFAANTDENSTHGQQGLATFIINAKGEMFMHSHEDEETRVTANNPSAKADSAAKTFVHSSFMNAGPVFFAGEIKIKNGKLISISNHSGHYQPSEIQLGRALLHMQNKGIDVRHAKVSVVRGKVIQEFGLAPDFLRYIEYKNAKLEPINAEMKEAQKEFDGLAKTKQLAMENKATFTLEQETKRQYLNRMLGQLAQKRNDVLRITTLAGVQAFALKNETESLISQQLIYSKDDKTLLSYKNKVDHLNLNNPEELKQLQAVSKKVTQLAQKQIHIQFKEVCNDLNTQQMQLKIALQKKDPDMQEQTLAHIEKTLGDFLKGRERKGAILNLLANRSQTAETLLNAYATLETHSQVPVPQHIQQFIFQLAKQQALQLIENKSQGYHQSNKALLTDTLASVKQAKNIDELVQTLDQLQAGYQHRKGIFSIPNTIRSGLQSVSRFFNDKHHAPQTDTFKKAEKIKGFFIKKN